MSRSRLPDWLAALSIGTALVRLVPVTITFVLALYGWVSISGDVAEFERSSTNSVYAMTIVFWVGLGLAMWELFAAIIARSRMLLFAASAIAATDLVAMIWLVLQDAVWQWVAVVGVTFTIQCAIISGATHAKSTNS